MKLLDAQFLVASLIWGSIGLGYCLYGKRQQSWVPFAVGVLLVATSYLVASVLVMSLISLALMIVAYVLLKQGW